MLCSQSPNNTPSNGQSDSDIFHTAPVQHSSRASTSLPTHESSLLLDPLSTITSLESSVMPPLLVTSVSSGIDSDLLQTTCHQSLSKTSSVCTQPYSANCGMTSMSAWLTNYLLKTSQSSGVLPPVTEIYSASRSNGGLRLLGLGKTSEIMPPSGATTESNELELNPSRNKKLLNGNVATRNVPKTESVTLANASSTISSSFQNAVNSVRVSSGNSKPLVPSLSENSSNHDMLSSSGTNSISCLRPPNPLLPLTVNGQVNSDIVTVPSLTSDSSLSNSNQVISSNQDFDNMSHGNRISNQIPLTHLDTLIHDGSGIIQSPLLSNNFPVSENVPSRQDILNPVNVSAVHLPSNTTSTLTNIAMPNATLSSNAVSLQFTSLLCLQSPSSQHNHTVSSCDDLLNSAIEETMCFKCKFCTFISLNKSQVVNHIKLSHSKSSEIIQLLSSSSEMKGMNTTMTVNNSNREVCTNLLSSGSQTESVKKTDLNTSFITLSSKTMSSEAEQTSNPKEKKSSGSEKHFFCGKCRKGFATLKDCKHHLANDHSVKSNRIRLENISSSGKAQSSNSSKPKNKTEDKLGTEAVAGMDKVSSTDLSNRGNEASQMQDSHLASKVGKKCGNLLKKTVHIKKINAEDGGKLVLSVRKKSELTSFQKAWKKKIKREQGSYICEYKGCNVRFRVLDNLEYHKKCHIVGTSAFACPECGIRLEHWGSIAGHLWRHHVVEMELHACDVCSYRTHSLAKLENLHKRIHRDERPFVCDSCGKAFKTTKQLKNHKAFHLKKGLNMQLCIGECSVCYRRFTDKRMLRSHLDTVHNKLRPFLCNYCGYSASSKSTLKMHMRQHTGEKPFACELCNYRTSDHNSLRRHKMRHSGEKPYKCPYCPYACIQASTYKTHLKNKHPGQDEGLLFSCTQCSFRTIKQENYLTHVADHQLDAFTQSNRNLPESLEIVPEHRSENLPLVEAMEISLSHGDKESVLTTSSIVASELGPVFSLC